MGVLVCMVTSRLSLMRFLILLIFSAVGGGCANAPVKFTEDMAKQGYAIWYPAESGIEPGQIWLYDGTLRAKFADRPKNMPLTTPAPLTSPSTV